MLRLRPENTKCVSIYSSSSRRFSRRQIGQSTGGSSSDQALNQPLPLRQPKAVKPDLRTRVVRASKNSMSIAIVLSSKRVERMAQKTIAESMRLNILEASAKAIALEKKFAADTLTSLEKSTNHQQTKI